MPMLFMPDCKETSRLVSESMDRQLPFFKRLMLWIHLRMCKYCQHFAQQLALLNAISRHINQQLESFEPPISLSDEARKRIQRALQAQIKGV